jgi:hypothetical protein
MSMNIPSEILALKGQRVNQVQVDEGNKKLIIRCERGNRRPAIDQVTGKKAGSIDRINDKLKMYPFLVSPAWARYS